MIYFIPVVVASCISIFCLTTTTTIVHGFSIVQHTQYHEGIISQKLKGSVGSSPFILTTSETPTTPTTTTTTQPTTTTSLCATDDDDTMDETETSSSSYNDVAFGFILLVGYVVTDDIIFAGLFLGVSFVAVLGTQLDLIPGKTNAGQTTTPAYVAILTLLFNSVLPKQRLYELLQPSFLAPTGTSLPTSSPLLPEVDIRIVQALFLSSSIIYGFFMASSSSLPSNEKTNLK